MDNTNNDEKWAALEEDETPAPTVPGDAVPGGLLAAGAALGSMNTGGMGIAGAAAFGAAIAESNEDDLAAAKARQDPNSDTNGADVSKAQSEAEADELNG
ncbi:MAG: hypothetical protein ABIQ44_08355 [Chloroflexia bacterium]